MLKVLVFALFFATAVAIDAVGVKEFFNAFGWVHLTFACFLIARQSIKQIRINHGW